MRQIKRYLVFSIFFVCVFSCKKSIAEKTAMTSTEVPSPIDDIKALINGSSCSKLNNFIINYESTLSSNEIRINYANSVLSIQSNKENTSTGLYEFLNLAGFKFYGPEEHWVFVPDCIDYSTLEIDTTINNQFNIKRIWPSFGFGNVKYSQFNDAKYKWNLWQQRLQLQQPSNLIWEHYGTKFNKKYKKEILLNPDWIAEGNLKRQWAKTVKLNYCNKNVVKLYLKDAKLRINEQQNGDHIYLNMEPPDGSNFSNCRPVSDQVFGLANTVANQYADNNTTIWLLAYNQHAMPPSFNLNKNILVGIVPDAFQKFTTPEELMRIWEEKHTNLFIRGYLALPQWNRDLPQWNEAKSDLNKIKHLKSKQYLGFNYESTLSFMAAGWNQYVIARASVDDNFNYDKEWDLFIANMFGDQKTEVKDLLQLLMNQNHKDYYLSYLYDEFNQLKSKSKDNLRNKRYNDLLFYIKFLQSYYNYLNSKNDDNIESLLNTLQEDNGNLNVHSWAIYKSLRFKNEYKNKPKIKTKFELKSINTPQLSKANNVFFTEPNIVSKDNKIEDIFSQKNIEFETLVDNDYDIKITAKPLNNAGKATLKVFDGDNIIAFKNIELDNKPHYYRIPKSKTPLKVEIANPNAVTVVSLPNKKIVLTKELIKIGRGTFNFYFVPKSKKVAFSGPKGSKISIYTNNGQLVDSKVFKDSYATLVLPDHLTNNLLKIESTSNQIKRLDQNHRLSLFPESYFEK